MGGAGGASSTRTSCGVTWFAPATGDDVVVGSVFGVWVSNVSFVKRDEVVDSLVVGVVDSVVDGPIEVVVVDSVVVVVVVVGVGTSLVSLVCVVVVDSTGSGSCADTAAGHATMAMDTTDSTASRERPGERKSITVLTPVPALRAHQRRRVALTATSAGG